MTHDELMQFTDLQRRVIALEAQAKADNDMTFAKAPTILNRLLEAHNRIDELERCKIYQEDNNVGQSKRIDALESKLQRDREESMCDMCKMFEQLSDAHHALCDVVDGVFYILKEHLVIDESSMNYSLRQIVKARLPQEAQDDRDSIDWREQDFDTQGAQDELASNDNSIDGNGFDSLVDDNNDSSFEQQPKRTQIALPDICDSNDNVGGVSDVDAIMGEMIKKVENNNIIIYGNNIWWVVRPTIERLVGERDEAVALSKNFYGIDVVIRQREEQRERAERAEAERDEFITKNDEKFREIQMLTKECGELEKDKARLDYLDDHWIRAECSAFGNWYISGKYCPPDKSDPVDVEEDGETLRQAIDNIMKEANDAE